MIFGQNYNMAFLLKKQYKLPYDICNKINLICINELIVNINKRILHMQLMSYFQTDIIYSMHEFYFVQLLVFLQKLKPIRAKFNDDYDVYDISLREEAINIYHYRLYRDHINIFLYQNKEYHIYYNQFE